MLKMFYLETVIMLPTSLARKDSQRLSPCPWLCVVCCPHYSLDEVGINIFSLSGAFLASADDYFVTATYSTIASEFHRNSDGQWILMAYNMGYCYALPIVFHVSI